jgi:SAM-dependent methyltransferase
MKGGGEVSGYSDEYQKLLDRTLAATGENRSYYARRRIDWLARTALLADRGHASATGSAAGPRLAIAQGRPAPSVLDFGCGDGDSAHWLRERLGAGEILGVDESPAAIRIARERYEDARTHFLTLSEYHPAGQFDVAYCNGVFHHIAPARRPAGLEWVWRALRPGGLFAIWENNPWNPGTRYLMKTFPLDWDAVPIALPEMERLLRKAGFRILRYDFLFIFPHLLRGLRFLEPWLSKLPLGGQYQLLCRREAAGGEPAANDSPAR